MKPKRRVASYDIDFQRFKKRREALAMTQRDLSEKSGLTQSMISQIECGAKARVWLSTANNDKALALTGATRLARSVVSMAVAQKLTGHRSLAVLLQVYTHVRDDESRKAIEGLPTLGIGGNVEKTSDGAERARSSALPS